MKSKGSERIDDVFTRLSRDFGLYSITWAVPVLSSAIVLIVFTDVFSPSTYGRFALTTSIATILETIFYGWISRAILRFEPGTERRELIRTTNMFIVLVGGLFMSVAALVYMAGAQFLGPFAPFFLAGTALTVAHGSFYAYRTLLQAQLKSKSFVRYTFIQTAGELTIALSVALVILNDIVGWLWGSAIASVLAAVLIVRRSGFHKYRPHLDWTLARRMFQYGVPLIGWLAGETLLTFGDRILVEILRGSAATGIYSSNYSIAHYGLMLAFVPLAQAAEPILMNLWDGDNESELAGHLTDMTRYFILIGVPGTVLFVMLSRPLSRLLLDPAYVEGAIIMPVIAVALLIWNATKIGQTGIEIKNRTMELFKGIAGVFVLNIIINVPLILAFGYLGAAFATLISTTAYALYIFFCSQHHIPWRLPRRTLGNVAIASLGMLVPAGLFIVIGQWGVGYRLVTAIVGAAIYLVVVYLTGEIESEELAKLSNLLIPTRK